jgi:Na+-driven multidrug efflux pump
MQLVSSLFLGHLGSIYIGAATLGNMLANTTGNCRSIKYVILSKVVLMYPGYTIGVGLATALDTLCSNAYGAEEYKVREPLFSSYWGKNVHWIGSWLDCMPRGQW